MAGLNIILVIICICCIGVFLSHIFDSFLKYKESKNVVSSLNMPPELEDLLPSFMKPSNKGN